MRRRKEASVSHSSSLLPSRSDARQLLRKLCTERREHALQSELRSEESKRPSTTNLVAARGRAADAAGAKFSLSPRIVVVVVVDVGSLAASPSAAAAAGAPPPLDEVNSERSCCSSRFIFVLDRAGREPHVRRKEKGDSQGSTSCVLCLFIFFFSVFLHSFFFLLLVDVNVEKKTNDSKPKRLLRGRGRGVHPRPLPRPAYTALGTGMLHTAKQERQERGQGGPF